MCRPKGKTVQTLTLGPPKKNYLLLVFINLNSWLNIIVISVYTLTLGYEIRSL